MPGRILIIDRSIPTPDQDSGSASTLSVLTILAKGGWQVTFAPFDMVDTRRYAAPLRKLGIKVVTRPAWESIEQAINHFAPLQDVILLYRIPVASVVFSMCRAAAPRTAVCFHAVDLHFLREQREAELTEDPRHAALARQTKELELTMVKEADATIVVSEFEKDLLSRLVPGCFVNHIPILRARPSGDTFRRFLLSRLSPANRKDLVFLGGYKHSPNVDAVLWFAETVWPRLLQAGFRGRFVIAGSHVPAQIAQLASKQIVVRGFVRNLAALFRNARLSVAPLRFGGGIKGKVVSSISYGVPVVGTAVAVEGMGLRDGENVLVADDPNAFAEKILEASTNDALWKRLSAGGLAVFDERFTHSAGAPKILALFDSLMERSRSSASTPYPTPEPS